MTQPTPPAKAQNRRCCRGSRRIARYGLAGSQWGGHWVSPSALAAVNAAIKKTGYRVNPHARNLATNRANSVAFLLTETQERLFEDPNFAVLMRGGAADALAVHDIPLVLIMAGTDDEQRRATDFLTAGHVDGVLLISSHGSRKGIIADIIAAGVPAIACGVPLGLRKEDGLRCGRRLRGRA